MFFCFFCFVERFYGTRNCIGHMSVICLVVVYKDDLTCNIFVCEYAFDLFKIKK